MDVKLEMNGKHYQLIDGQWVEFTPPVETTQASIADAAIRHLEAAHSWWMEEGTWAVFEHPETHPGAVTIQVCISRGPERDAETRQWAADILESVGWRTEIIPPTEPDHFPYIVAYPPVVVVTRHTALVDWLREAGHIPADAAVIAHVDSVEQIQGKHVIGILPLALAVHTAAVTEVALRLPPAAYGREWTLDELREGVQGVRQYQIRSWPAPRGGYDLLTAPYPAARDWLAAQHPGVPVLADRLTAADVAGKNVLTLLGLPLHLATGAATVTAYTLDLPLEARGQQLTAADFDRYAGPLVTARVRG